MMAVEKAIFTKILNKVVKFLYSEYLTSPTFLILIMNLRVCLSISWLIALVLWISLEIVAKQGTLSL